MATETGRAQFGRHFIERAQLINPPKSLAELALCEDEYDELLTWASRISGRHVWESLLWNFGAENIGGEVWGSGDVTGFLLLLTISEIARRQTQEGICGHRLASIFQKQAASIYSRARASRRNS